MYYNPTLNSQTYWNAYCQHVHCYIYTDISGEKYLPDVDDEDIDDNTNNTQHQLANENECDDSIDQELPASAMEAIDK